MIVTGDLVVRDGQALNLNGSNLVISGNLSLSDSLVALSSSSVVVDGSSSPCLSPLTHTQISCTLCYLVGFFSENQTATLCFFLILHLT